MAAREGQVVGSCQRTRPGGLESADTSSALRWAASKGGGSPAQHCKELILRSLDHSGAVAEMAPGAWGIAFSAIF